MPPGSKHAVFTEDAHGIMLNILIRMTTFEAHFLSLIPNDDLLRTFFTRALYQSPQTPYLLFHTAGDPQLQTITEDIYDEFVHFRRYKNSMLDSLLSTFFVLLLRKHDKDVSIPGAHGNLDNENMIFIIQYMQKHFNTITLSELASFFNYSERQIERIIIGATEKTSSRTSGQFECTRLPIFSPRRVSPFRKLPSRPDFMMQAIFAVLSDNFTAPLPVNTDESEWF